MSVKNFVIKNGATIGNVVIDAASSNISNANVVTANLFSGNGNGLSSLVGANVTGQVANALVAGTVYTNAQPNITSVGTLTGLTSTGTVNLTGASNVSLGPVGNVKVTGGTSGQVIQTDGNGNLSFATIGTSGIANGTSSVAIPTVNGNINLTSAGNATMVVTGTGANITGTANVSGNLSAANVDAGNLLTANYVAGTLTTVAQPNITSVGILTSLVVSGNIQSNANVITDNILGLTGALTITSGGTNTNINLKPNGTGNIDANSTYITNVLNPANNQDAATKAYVDQQITTGISYHQPVNAATTTTLAIATGGTTAYNSPNGAANGIGAYISTTGTFALIDTANIAVANSRILVKDEANAAWNGVYNYTNATAITRTLDTDQYGSSSTEELSINDYFFTQQGNVNLGTAFVVSGPAGVITFGTSNITFATFSTSQVYSNGVGLALNGTQFSIANTAVTPGSYGAGDSIATFSVNQQGQLTAAANVAVTANAANLTGTVLNANVVTSSLTSVGTLGNLAVTSNITAGNVYANAGTIGAANLTGTLTTNAQPNVTSLGTLTGLNVNAAVNAISFTSNATTGTAPLAVSSTTRVANLNVDYANVADFGVVTTQTTGTFYPVFVNGNTTANYAQASNANLSFNAATGALSATLLTGTLTTNAQPNITSVGTLTSLDVSNTITAANITANTGVFTGNGNGLSSLVGANVTGQVGNALVASTVYTNAQPNITSVGTLTSLVVSGNITTNYVAFNGGAMSNRSDVAVSTSATVIDQFSTTAFRTAKYVISASSANGYQSVEALLVHNGSNAYITVYGSLCTNDAADLIDISANVNGVSGNVALYATANSTVSATANVNVVVQYILT